MELNIWIQIWITIAVLLVCLYFGLRKTKWKNKKDIKTIFEFLLFIIIVPLCVFLGTINLLSEIVVQGFVNPWYLLSFFGAIELWIIVAPAICFIYFLLRKTEKIKAKKTLKNFLFLFIISLIISASLIHFLKKTIDMPRICIVCPADNCNPYCPTNNAFPSGHAGTIFTLFISIYIAVGRKKYIPIFIIPILVTYSRIVLGVHTYLDVLIGSAIGIIVPILIWCYVKNKKNFFKN